LVIVEGHDTTSFLACALDFLGERERGEDFGVIEVTCKSASKRIELLHLWFLYKNHYVMLGLKRTVVH